ncbi:MAG: energy-coupled thiamine transporter ThiT [Lachnospiraceae bacterium]|nr:energy-coupled thiamine transporter ThiT [Lachnospiraceae bacterium]
MKQSFSVKGLAFCGVCIALAFVMSFVKLFSAPLGGSVTLCSMFFICVIGYFYGWKYSLTAAFAYGLLQFVQKPDIYSPMQVIIDYFCAFTALGLSGFFRKSKAGLYIGYLAGVTGRFIFSSISGYVFFAEYAPEGWNPLIYSLCYNGSYIYIEAAITLVIIAIPAVEHAIERIRNTVIQAPVPKY